MRTVRLLALLRACHPDATAAVTVVAILLAVAAGRNWPGVAATGVAVLASQLAVGWSNDAIDAERDRVTGRLDKPIPSGAVSRRTVATGAVAAAAATAPLALLSGILAAVFAVIGLAGGLLYNWPLKSTVASVLPYAVSFAALPAFVLLGAGRTPAPWLLLAGAALGAGAHFANVLPDLADDARTGVQGLPHRLGATGSGVAAAGLLLLATAVLAFGPPGAPSWLGYTAFVAAVVVPASGLSAAARTPGSRAAFRAVLVVALLDVVLLLASGGAR